MHGDHTLKKTDRQTKADRVSASILSTWSGPPWVVCSGSAPALELWSESCRPPCVLAAGSMSDR